MSNSLITRISACALLALLLPISVFGQFETSSMSMGMSRAGLIPSSESIRVEELINYHKHLIPVPDGQQRVALDMQWGQIGGRAVVQIASKYQSTIVNALESTAVTKQKQAGTRLGAVPASLSARGIGCQPMERFSLL